MATESPHSSTPRSAASDLSAARMNIGEVLDLLHEDFPSISIPKIRFLEEKGIVTPERTSSGYRKFSHADVERLRYALLLQRDHHQPLARIVEILDAIDRGLEPPPLVDLTPMVPDVALSADGLPSPESFRRHDDLRLSRRELLKIAEITEELLDQLEQFGLVVPRRGHRPLRLRCAGHLHDRPRARRLRPRAAAPAGVQDRRRPRGRAGRAGRRPAAPGLRPRGVRAPGGHRLPARRAVGAAARHAGEVRAAQALIDTLRGPTWDPALLTGPE